MSGAGHEVRTAEQAAITADLLELLRDLDRLHAGGLDRDEWMARKRALIERIEPGFYAGKGDQ